MSSFRPALVAVASVALVLVACGAQGADDGDLAGSSADVDDPSDDGSDPAADPTEPAPGGSDDAQDPEPVVRHAPAPEPAEPYALSPDEMLPDAKRVAAELVRTLLTYDPADTPAEIVGRVAAADRASDLLVTAAPVLHADAWSRGEIVYPQLGGFTETEASVMVVARQTVGLADGEVVEETRTFDVRLVVEDGDWTFDELASAGGRPVERPDDLSEIAAAVVDDARIELPDTARWDIYGGAIEPTLLELMAIMAERTPYGVVVLDTGHPWEVFGTDRQSRHSLGRAIDIYRLDGPDIIDDREDGSATHEFVLWLYEQPEMTNMGAPWSLDDFGGRSFTDDLHQDHLHVESAASDPAD